MADESEALLLFDELERLDSSSKAQSYRMAGIWDVQGLKDDLSIAKRRAATHQPLHQPTIKALESLGGIKLGAKVRALRGLASYTYPTLSTNS